MLQQLHVELGRNTFYRFYTTRKIWLGYYGYQVEVSNLTFLLRKLLFQFWMTQKKK